MMTAVEAVRRRGYAAESELRLRNAVEAWCRDRWPDARVVHEMVMGAGRVRADVVALSPEHIVAIEVKGEYDDTTRLLHQVGMYQLCVPEVWMIVTKAKGHDTDASYIRHLLPSVGLLVADGMRRNPVGGEADIGKAVTLTVVAEAVPRPVVPELMLEMLWAAELTGCCNRLRVSIKSGATRPKMIKALLSDVHFIDLQREVCTALRGRDALWRADPAIPPIKRVAA